MKKTILALSILALTAVAAGSAFADHCRSGYSHDDNGKCVRDSRGSH